MRLFLAMLYAIITFSFFAFAAEAIEYVKNGSVSAFEKGKNNSYILSFVPTDEYTSDRDGSKTYNSKVYFIKYGSDGRKTAYYLGSYFCGGPEESNSTLVRGAIKIVDRQIAYVFINEKSYKGMWANYSQNGYLLSLDMQANKVEKYTVYSGANDGWFPYFNSSDDLVYFSFDGYYNFINGENKGRIEPSVSAVNMQNAKMKQAKINTVLEKEIPWQELSANIVKKIISSGFGNSKVVEKYPVITDNSSYKDIAYNASNSGKKPDYVMVKADYNDGINLNYIKRLTLSGGSGSFSGNGNGSIVSILKDYNGQLSGR